MAFLEKPTHPRVLAVIISYEMIRRRQPVSLEKTAYERLFD
jgi:hypothetical protein